MIDYRLGVSAAALTAALLLVAGCSKDSEHQSTNSSATTAAKNDEADDTDADIRKERAKLSSGERTLVEAQEWCVIQSSERLGSMGPPVRLMINDKPVYVCCKGCSKKAESDPVKTLAKVEELKAKKKKTNPME